MIHELKTWVASYRGVEDGVKTHEWRRDDRDFRVGDVLVLKEYDNIREAFTGRETRVEVTWKTEGGTFGVPHGWCVLSVAKVVAEGKMSDRDFRRLAHAVLIEKGFYPSGCSAFCLDCGQVTPLHHSGCRAMTLLDAGPAS